MGAGGVEGPKMTRRSSEKCCVKIRNSEEGKAQIIRQIKQEIKREKREFDNNLRAKSFD